MKMLLLSGHDITPHVVHCELSDLLKQPIEAITITISNTEYKMHYSTASDADICVAGWCLRDLDDTSYRGLSVMPIRGNALITHINGAGLNDCDCMDITKYIDMQSDHWCESAVFSIINISHEYIVNRSIAREQLDTVLVYGEFCKIVMNATHPCRNSRKLIIEHPSKTYYLDTETTGTDSETDEILSISIVDEDGCVVLDQLIKPTKHDSWPLAAAIHHITPEMVANAPTWESVQFDILNIYLMAKHVIIYGKNFDTAMLARDMPEDVIKLIDQKSICCMVPFALVYGDWSDYYGSYKYQKLTTAMAYYNLPWIGEAHGSLADTYACRAVWERMVKNA